MKKSAEKAFGVLVFAILILSCGNGQNQPTADLKVTNGVQIDESQYPAVVAILTETEEGRGLCTATFIASDLLLTAGHCVIDALRNDDGTPQIAYVLIEEDEEGNLKAETIADASAAAPHPTYELASFFMGPVNPYDIAYVRFSQDVAPATRKLAIQAMTAGDSLTIVGYGVNEYSFNTAGELQRSGSGYKRQGRNTVSAVDDGFIYFEGVANNRGTLGENVSSGNGDSGGPMFNANGEIVGVTSGGSTSQGAQGPNNTNLYVDILSATSLEFMRAIR